MELFDLHGKVALVTGGNGGIGLGIARALAQAGADVAVAGRDEHKCAAAVAQLEETGSRAIGVVADVRDAAAVQDMLAQTEERLGGLDILVANAGTNLRRRPEEYTVEEWHTILDTNLTAVFSCCQAAYPRM